MIFGHFDHAYVMNLNTRPDRMAAVSAHMDRLHIPFIRIEGETRTQACGFKNTSTHAIAMTHTKAIQTAQENGDKAALIFEDDVLMRDDVAERVQAVMPFLNDFGWDVLYLGQFMKQRGKQINENLFKFGQGLHLHAYAINGNSIPVILEVIERHYSGRVKVAIDWVFNNAKRLRKFYVEPILAIQRISASDNHGNANRYREYFKFYSKEEFVAHCAELRDGTIK